MSVWRNKKRNTWVAKFKFQGRQYKREGFKTRSEAEDWKFQRRKDLKNPSEPEPEVIRLTFSQASTIYLEDCQARFQKNTWRQKAFVYRNFLSFVNENPPADSITNQIFREYLRCRIAQDGNCAANRDLKEFKALYNWCIHQELLLQNPCINIQKYPEEPKVKYVPPEEDIKKVIMAADPDDMDLIQIIYYTAGRISEILNLKWEDINFEHNWIRLWTRKRRGGELQEDKLPIGGELFRILKRRWHKRDKLTPYVFHNEDGTKFTYHQKGHTIKKVCEKANVKPFGFHAIRHHIASILADSGKARRLVRSKNFFAIAEVPLQTIILRHSIPS